MMCNGVKWCYDKPKLASNIKTIYGVELNKFIIKQYEIFQWFSVKL